MKRGPPDIGPATPGDGSIEDALDTARQVLREAAERDDVAFLWTGGKEAQVIADLLLYDVGDAQGVSAVPFVTLGTGNPLEGMETFRKEYATPSGVGPVGGLQHYTIIRDDDLVDGVLQNPDDPRGYHGRWDGDVELPPPEEVPVDGLPRRPDEWDVTASCGAAKVGALRNVLAKGIDALITGRRGDDPLVAGTDADFGTAVERREPRPHVRYNPLAEWSEAFVYAYIKRESVPLADLYTDEGYRHTDTACCTDDQQVGEYGEGGRDPRKVARQQDLEDMGYV